MKLYRGCLRILNRSGREKSICKYVDVFSLKYRPQLCKDTFLLSSMRIFYDLMVGIVENENPVTNETSLIRYKYFTYKQRVPLALI